MNRALTLEMSETRLTEAIRELSRLLGLRIFHCYDARRSWGPGYPDLTIVGPRGVIFRECKTENGKTSTDQDGWAVALQEAGQDWAIWRPSDLASGRIKRELERLVGR